jgi:hypothetical protein
VFEGPSICLMCYQEEENRNNLLSSCRVASYLWEHRALLLHKYDRIRHDIIKTLKEWRVDPFRNQILNRVWNMFPRFLFWNLWKARKKRLFQHQHPHLTHIWQGILTNVCETISMVPWQNNDWLATRNKKEILSN